MPWPPQKQRSVGLSRNDRPPPLLSTYRNPAMESKSEDPPPDDSQLRLTKAYARSNKLISLLSDPIEDDEFEDLGAPRSKDVGPSTRSLPDHSPLPLKEEEDPDFWESSRSKGYDPCNSFTEDSGSKDFLSGPNTVAKEESPRREEVENRDKWMVVGDDNENAPLASDSDNLPDIPLYLTGGDNQKKSLGKKGNKRTAKKSQDSKKRAGPSKSAPPLEDDISDGEPVSKRGDISSTSFRRKEASTRSDGLGSSQGSKSGKKAPTRGSGLDASYKGSQEDKTNRSAGTSGPASSQNTSRDDKPANSSLAEISRITALDGKIDSANRKRKSTGDEESDICEPDPRAGKVMFDQDTSKPGASKSKPRAVFGRGSQKLGKKENKEEPASKKAKKDPKVPNWKMRLKKQKAVSDSDSESDRPQKKERKWIPPAIKSEEPSSPAGPPASKLSGTLPLFSPPAKNLLWSKIPARLGDTDNSSPEKSQRPSFKLLTELSDFEEPSFLNSPLTRDILAGSDLLLRGRSNSPLTDLDTDIPVGLDTICPLCKKEVDNDYHAEFTKKSPVWTLQNMQIFCKGHNRKTAKDFWNKKGYPKIKWSKLDHRISQHLQLLRTILEGQQPSYYGDLFKDKIKSGQNRTLLRSDELNLTPGYYGIRGLRQMSENLIHEFSSVLRKRALEDNLIGARGYSTYLQAVLVPELAVRLIMDDMKVGEEEARKVLGESSWVGEVLHDEIADVVDYSSEEDEKNLRR
ncbi:RTC4-like domain-containing protein [Podospora fimiseda]|uniref:Restriction of telomere capping protein 4 n=1 Tax=Podospora fimiseda TaxID=252190 RepID=A0AAN7BY45_9PEZI|nr:RTC4-like domain-containing protein [Podospora fimiseda]